MSADEAVYDRRARMREGAALQGCSAVALPTIELIATVLQAGARGDDPRALASRLLADHGGLTGLGTADLRRVRGMGPAKAVRLHAALELGRRLWLESTSMPLQVCSPHDLGPRLVAEMGSLEQECLRVVLLNTKNYLLAMPTIYVGSVDQVTIHPRDVFREAVRRNATGVILAHNHPSTDPVPSREDIVVTRDLVRAGMVLGIEVLDHLVIASGSAT